MSVQSEFLKSLFDELTARGISEDIARINVTKFQSQLKKKAEVDGNDKIDAALSKIPPASIAENIYNMLKAEDDSEAGARSEIVVIDTENDTLVKTVKEGREAASVIPEEAEEADNENKDPEESEVSEENEELEETESDEESLDESEENAEEENEEKKTSDEDSDLSEEDEAEEESDEELEADEENYDEDDTKIADFVSSGTADEENKDENPEEESDETSDDTASKEETEDSSKQDEEEEADEDGTKEFTEPELPESEELDKLFSGEDEELNIPNYDDEDDGTKIFTLPGNDSPSDELDEYAPEKRKIRKGLRLEKEKKDKDHIDSNYLYDNDPDKKNGWLFYVFAVILFPLAVLVGAVVFAFFIGLWLAIALVITLLLVGVFALAAVGSLASLCGLIFGLIELISGNAAAAMFEVGLALIVGACILFVGILIYNLAVRFLPFIIKKLGVLLVLIFKTFGKAFKKLKKLCSSL